MKVFLRVAAGIALACVLVVGGYAGVAVLPVVGVHVQTGAIPNGMALRIDAMPGVHLRVVSTAEAGGTPRFEYRMASLAEPLPNPFEDRRTLSPSCVSPSWGNLAAQGCHGELVVVVKAGRPVRLHCFGERLIKPDVGDDIFVEENYCKR